MVSISNPEVDSTLHLRQLKTQGKNTWKKQQQAAGTDLEDDYLHNLLKFEYAESDTIISISFDFSKLTPPILLPHPTTLYPNYSFKYLAAISTSLLYFCPRVMKSAS